MKTKIFAVGMVAGSLILSACAADVAAQTATAEQVEFARNVQISANVAAQVATAESAERVQVSANLAALPTITVAAAEELAKSVVGGGDVANIRLETVDGERIFAVSVRNNDRLFEIILDATDGNLLSLRSLSGSENLDDLDDLNAASAANGAEQSEISVAETAENTMNPPTVPTVTPTITAENARRIALERTNGGTFTRNPSVVFDNQRYAWVWDMEIRTEGAFHPLFHEVFVDIITGRILRSATSRNSTGVSSATIAPTPNPNQPQNTPISQAMAREIAQTFLAEMGIVPSEFAYARLTENSHRGWVWDVEFRDFGLEYEFLIDVETGEILKFEIDRD